ncbi:MAG TPA: SMP-30/gluconolactonase/LRE family protein, partial [Pirellulales bacterium]|nr:SMP-30/gluconolactonase/LRE family protein [Pirellulales bacterium]
FDGGCVVHYDDRGRELGRVTVPTAKVTCPAFGGAQLDELYIATGGGGDRVANGPAAGALFRARPGVCGRAEYLSRVAR